jgi:hypothetical protein
MERPKFQISLFAAIILMLLFSVLLGINLLVKNVGVLIILNPLSYCVFALWILRRIELTGTSERLNGLATFLVLTCGVSIIWLVGMIPFALVQWLSK